MQNADRGTKPGVGPKDLTPQIEEVEPFVIQDLLHMELAVREMIYRELFENPN